MDDYDAETLRGIYAICAVAIGASVVVTWVLGHWLHWIPVLGGIFVGLTAFRASLK